MLNYADTRIYFYDNEIVDTATTIKSNKRWNLEIKEINKTYLEIVSLIFFKVSN